MFTGLRVKKENFQNINNVFLYKVWAPLKLDLILVSLVFYYIPFTLILLLLRRSRI